MYKVGNIFFCVEFEQIFSAYNNLIRFFFYNTCLRI